MNITVLGLWHLGSVTAACCAKHFPVVGLDFDRLNVARLNEGHAPISEPGLNDLVLQGFASRQLSFTCDARAACANADVLWLTYDTPVDDEDESDVDFVLESLRKALPFLRPHSLVLISAQLPVGTCASLECEFPQFEFACSPENLRLGKALDAFERADRVVVGIRSNTQKQILEEVFSPFTGSILFMRTESAEMVKHALNSFLALSITYINEIARLCEQTGADAREVSIGLKSDVRIGPKAYLSPGGPFAGGTLARDVVTLTKLAAATGERIAVIPAIKHSNDEHRTWAFRRLADRLGNLDKRIIAVLGLTYTSNTDTLRRSASLELCAHLLEGGANVRAFDPAVNVLPSQWEEITLSKDISSAVYGADAVVVCTECPVFRQANWASIIPLMRRPLIVDANRFLEKELGAIRNVEYVFVGRS